MTCYVGALPRKNLIIDVYKRQGVPYDGCLTKEDGKGKWWEGYDPQKLYAQNHPLSAGSLSLIHI